MYTHLGGAKMFASDRPISSEINAHIGGANTLVSEYATEERKEEFLGNYDSIHLHDDRILTLKFLFFIIYI